MGGSFYLNKKKHILFANLMCKRQFYFGKFGGMYFKLSFFKPFNGEPM